MKFVHLYNIPTPSPLLILQNHLIVSHLKPYPAKFPPEMTFLPKKSESSSLSLSTLSPSNEATLYILWSDVFLFLYQTLSPPLINTFHYQLEQHQHPLDQTSTSSFLNICPHPTQYHIPKLPSLIWPSHHTILYFRQHQLWLGGTWRGLGTHNTIVCHPVPLPLLYHAFLQWSFGHLVPRSFAFCRGVAPLCSVRKALVILNKALGACWLFPQRHLTYLLTYICLWINTSFTHFL